MLPRRPEDGREQRIFCLSSGRHECKGGGGKLDVPSTPQMCFGGSRLKEPSPEAEELVEGKDKEEEELLAEEIDTNDLDL